MKRVHIETAASNYSNRETALCGNVEARDAENNNMKGPQPMSDRNSNTLSSSASVQLRRPENLKLSEISLTNDTDNGEPSPALSERSPYIPISECFSGSPVLNQTTLNNYENNFTALNSLNPKFYDTPRSHVHIGKLNLTTNVFSVRPKSSGSDSESVFTDDDLASSHSYQNPVESIPATMDRRLRPSDSSVENEIIGWTYTQRFSKVPDDIKSQNTADPPPIPPKLIHGHCTEINIKASQVPQNSDTENTSPAIIGPKDRFCGVDESYDIPRSHRLPHCGTTASSPQNSPPFVNSGLSPNVNFMVTSTPNLFRLVKHTYLYVQSPKNCLLF